MSEKNIKVRLQQKHDTSANWALATNFKPKAGELIIYDDLKKMKVGDGETLVNNLPFLSAEVSQPDYNQNDETASDYIKNRPFYSGYDVSAALFDQTVDITTIEDNDRNIYFWASTSTIPYTKGAIVQLIVDGEKYTCEVEDVEGEFYGIGNFGILQGEDTGEPCFVIFDSNMFTGESGATIVFKEAKTTSHVQIVPESINYLDPKYIKDMYYTETKTYTSLDTFFTTTVDSNGRNSCLISGERYSLLPGYKHKVVYKGTTYILDYKYEQFTYDDQSVNVPYIGNASLYDTTKENTGEPFFITMNSSIVSGGVLIITNEAQTDAYIEITADYDVIHYLDDTYIDAANRLKTWIKDAQTTSSFSIPTPSKSTDLVDKQYTDQLKITSINGLAGGTLTSPLVINSTVGLDCELGTGFGTPFPLIQYNGQEITIGTVTSKPLKIIGGTESTIGGIKFNEIATKTEVPNIEEYSGIRWLSYNDTFSMTTSPDAKWYDTNGNEITDQIGTGNYVDGNCGNSRFNSTEDVIDLNDMRSLIFRVVTRNGAILPDKYIVSSNGYTIHAADIICLVEDDVPDRKAMGPSGLIYTVLKAKMINGAALDKANIFTKINTFNLGIETVGNDALTTYKCGTIQYQYGSNNFTLTLPTAAGTIATQEYVTTQIGDINTLLTALNSGTGV